MSSIRFLLLVLSCTAAIAGAPDKFAQVAGPQPTESQARDAVIEELKRTVKEAADFSRVRFMSGPHLVTGTNFAQGREQAWLMCVVEGNASTRRGPLELDMKPYLLRTKDNRLQVIPTANWSDFENKC